MTATAAAGGVVARRDGQQDSISVEAHLDGVHRGHPAEGDDDHEEEAAHQLARALRKATIRLGPDAAQLRLGRVVDVEWITVVVQ